MGFHAKCKNYKYTGTGAKVNKIESLLSDWENSRGGNYWCPPFPQLGPQYIANPYPANWGAMRPPPANQKTTIVDIHHSQEDEDDE